MKTYRFLVMLSVVLLCAACGSPAPTPSAADIQTAISETLTTAPTITSTPTQQPEDTPEPSPTVELSTPTPTPGRPLDAVVNVDFLNMRSGPSTFFEVVGTFEDGSNLVAKSRIPDNSWVLVEVETDAEPLTGWMFAAYLDLDGSITQLSLTSFPTEQTVWGLVQDENRDPLEGVVIAVVLSNDPETRLVNATTDPHGRFVTYFPADMFGILDVQVVNPLCESILVDENCQVSSHILLNNREFISIPQENQEIIFVYETAAFTLTGTVTDRSNQPVEDISITAIRDDGAVSYGYSDANGEFALPISEGIWEIYTVEFNPRSEGDHVIVTIADTIPDPIDLKSP